MGFHAFSLDPRTILGVSPEATPEEIHEAYREKSKKHHPDRGGDEWAFRMVARAYEVLKATTSVSPGVGPASGAAMRQPPPDAAGWGRSADWRWSWGPDPARPRAGEAEAVSRAAADQPAATAAGPRIDPSRMRSVDVELIWTRFEKDRPVRMPDDDAEGDDGTLSVCMVISWPEAELVEYTPEFPEGGEILRALIDLFDRLRDHPAIVASRSRIEDGRFVGWLSYPDVLTAQDAVLTVRDAFRSAGLAIKLQTRDERIPFDWHAPSRAPVMSQAS